MSNHNQYDLFVIGGGINGLGIANDAAGRGLRVALCDKGDLGGATSSASTKLIHGGLRYLEHFQLRLVRESLKEREVILNKAPHLVKPMEFILPHTKHLRPAWIIRIGLFLYDHLAKRIKIPPSRTIYFENDLRGTPILSSIRKGFAYYDCWADDARLVISNALQAKEFGAYILPRNKCVNAVRLHDGWEIQVKNTLTHETTIWYAKALINAAGPWVKHVQENILEIETNIDISLDKGSHIITPKLYDGAHAYLLQNPDHRVIFTIPFQNDYTLIGTTEILLDTPEDNPAISDKEIDYLCNSVNHYFKRKINSDDIVYSYSGIRTLRKESGNVWESSRDYYLHLDAFEKTPPLLTVYGGKLTTYRKLAEQVLKKLSPFFPNMKAPWTHKTTLPGGNFQKKDPMRFSENLQQKYPWLPVEVSNRYSESYGTLSHKILGNTETLSGMGKHFGHGLYEKEVRYLIEQEWVVNSNDILWRRTKLGMRFTPKEVYELQQWFSLN